VALSSTRQHDVSIAIEIFFALPPLLDGHREVFPTPMPLIVRGAVTQGLMGLSATRDYTDFWPNSPGKSPSSLAGYKIGVSPLLIPGVMLLAHAFRECVRVAALYRAGDVTSELARNVYAALLRVAVLLHSVVVHRAHAFRQNGLDAFLNAAEFCDSHSDPRPIALVRRPGVFPAPPGLRYLSRFSD
jgi:hypothetical protein